MKTKIKLKPLVVFGLHTKRRRMKVTAREREGGGMHVTISGRTKSVAGAVKKNHIKISQKRSGKSLTAELALGPKAASLFMEVFDGYVQKKKARDWGREPPC